MKKGDLVEIILKEPFYVVQSPHGYYELWRGPQNNKILIGNSEFDMYYPQVRSIVGYISGGNEHYLHINPYGSNRIQIDEDGTRSGDYIIERSRIEKIKTLKDFILEEL